MLVLPPLTRPLNLAELSTSFDSSRFSTMSDAGLKGSVSAFIRSFLRAWPATEDSFSFSVIGVSFFVVVLLGACC